MKMDHVLCVIHDPGGIQCFRGLLPKLKEASKKLLVVHSPFAIGRLDLSPYQTKLIETTHVDLSTLEDIFTTFQPDCIFTGTSWASDLEQKARNLAYTKQIPSVVALDYWRNFSSRWSGSKYSMGEMKDLIFVPGEKVKEEMIHEGFSRHILKAIRQPHLDDLARNFKPSLKDEAQKRRPKIIIMSEPVDGHEKMNLFSGSHPIEWIIKNTPKKFYPLSIKLHPKEDSQVSALLSQTQNHGSYDFVSQGTIFPKNFDHYDWVIGFQSMALFEARVLGKRVLSLPTREMTGALKNAFEEYSITQIDWDQSSYQKWLEQNLEFQELEFKLPSESSAEEIIRTTKLYFCFE